MRLIFSFVLALASISLGLAQTERCSGPLSEQQVIDLLQRRIPDARVQGSVDTCGISFSTTQDTLRRLEQAGATSVVLASLRKKGEQQTWAALKNGRTSSAFEDFLRIYPESEFATEAPQKLAELRITTCPRPQTGESVSAPKDLRSVNGQLKVDLSFRTSVGLVRPDALLIHGPKGSAGAHAAPQPG